MSRSRRSCAAALVVALVLASCGGSSEEGAPADGDIGDGVSLNTTSTTGAAGAATTAAPQAQGTVKPGAATTAKPGSAGPKSTAAPLPTQAPAPGADPIVTAARGPAGSAAGMILQPDPAKAIVVELLVEPGTTANQPAIDTVVANLREFSGKAVSVQTSPLPAGSDGKKWTESELAKLADTHSKVPQGGGRFVFKFLFVNGANARSNSILGVAFRGDLFAAFPDQYERTTTPQRVITTVIVHEAGHLLGLVDLYLRTGRQDTKNDPARGGHSSNQNSVMYWAVDPFLFGGIFGSGTDKFDDEDKKDLAAIRAGATFGSKGPPR